MTYHRDDTHTRNGNHKNRIYLVNQIHFKLNVMLVHRLSIRIFFLFFFWYIFFRSSCDDGVIRNERFLIQLHIRTLHSVTIGRINWITTDGNWFLENSMTNLSTVHDAGTNNGSKLMRTVESSLPIAIFSYFTIIYDWPQKSTDTLNWKLFIMAAVIWVQHLLWQMSIANRINAFNWAPTQHTHDLVYTV